MKRQALSSGLRSLAPLRLGALLVLMTGTPHRAAALPGSKVPLTAARVAACQDGLTSGVSTDVQVQPTDIARGCLSGCQDLPLFYSEFPAAPALKRGACELACSGPAWEKAAAADPGSRWQVLIDACPKGYFPLAGGESFASPLLLSLGRASQFLTQVASSPDPAIASAWKELQGWLRFSQFRLQLPARLSGRYQLARTGQPASDSFDLGIYVWVGERELRIGIVPAVGLTDRGTLIHTTPGAAFPGQPVALKDLGTALGLMDIAMKDSCERFGIRHDANLDELATGHPVLKSTMALRSPEQQFDRRAPLVLIDANLPAARLADVISALGERGGRLAIADPNLRVRWHAVRLRNPAGPKVPEPSATLRLGAQGYTLWAGDPARSPSVPLISDRLPVGEKRARILRHNVPQWIHKPEGKPARIECGAKLPVAELVAVLDSLAAAHLWESALVIP